MAADAPPPLPAISNSRYMRVDDAGELEGSNRRKRIFKAYDTEEGVEVAMHVVAMWGRSGADPSAVAALKSPTLNHENLIRVLDAWVDGSALVIITPMLTAGTLQSYVARIDDVRFRVLRKWARQLLQALNHLHSQGGVHGDLRLSNFFINGTTGNVLLGYFTVGMGVDVTVDGDDFERAIRYLPPEISPAVLAGAHADDGDGKTGGSTPPSLSQEGDVYAFGMCLLEMVTGKLPYAAYGGDWRR
jgi:WNK lysine deficient protein kinase